ncbi:MAG: tRNA (adenine-N1)-methyltransferase, partial [Candidatus Nanopelagicus sp.]
MIDRNFQYGDRVQLTDAKGKLYSITLKKGAEWHTHKGMLKHDELVGIPEGSIVTTNQELKFQAFRPLLADYLLSMPRGATIIYPKDTAMILGVADIKPGVRVLEAGVGSGALSISILRAIGDSGFLHSIELREDFAEIARDNVTNYFKVQPKNWQITIGQLEDQKFDAEFDRVVLDMLTPWECLTVAANALVPGGVFMAYVATTTQLSRMAEAIKESANFTEPESLETMVRGWH